MLITCQIHGKIKGFMKKTAKLYVKWLEIEPEKYICRDCGEMHIWSNAIQFKLIASSQSLKKIARNKIKTKSQPIFKNLINSNIPIVFTKFF